LSHATKTNAMRALEALMVPYQVYTFPPDIHSAEGVARVVGLPAEQVYKTLVVLRHESPAKQARPMLVMIAGDREIDLKVLARSLGEKKLRMATYREAEQITGLQVGGISALALLNRGFEVYIDQVVTSLSHVLVSAGRRGINLRLRVDDLIQVTGARIIQATADYI
jgi:Cys-tRNA(Pro)/Cys-tRNA(Cys) deacylase